ncbi:hypothetical protein SAMD00019534_056030 [Acytostelium subglobosum LB1]|uniref:hypothetical protein n=1 Tax=Acytostelium subglobosum LB1 TaxID=1410327 RepID=UPI000644EE50|nr:hypothetical protein SAMD00019534_056030 [Acytostelium subglobosum LB1]GAM22428.1 hypothetical protein SAMD00019534_056030 [Acytostelium subglobosum LB1]|eukprot:XP_012754548.1 hypothetical protein SAMD00019534_056030 [Acytostelium subglobosum LB1]
MLITDIYLGPIANFQVLFESNMHGVNFPDQVFIMTLCSQDITVTPACLRRSPASLISKITINILM